MEEQITDFTLNDQYIFIWNSKQIHYFKFDDEFTLETNKTIDLVIQKEDKHISIESLKCGSNSNTLMILIN